MRIEPRTVINFIAFQVAWLLCVLGGANEQAIAGTMCVAAAILLHLALAQRPDREIMLIAAAALVGFFWDSALVALGLMHYPTGNFAAGFAPYWIIAMWALFATSLNLSMAWLKGRIGLAAAFGAAGGPLAYLAGERLGGVQITDPGLALSMQAVGWAVLLPLLTRLASRLNGFDEPGRPGLSHVSEKADDGLFRPLRTQAAAPGQSGAVGPGVFYGLAGPRDTRRTLNWWSRRESNPRPQALHKQFYMRSRVV